MARLLVQKRKPTRRWRRLWTESEVAALEAGVERHGAGKWIYILKDQSFGPQLKGEPSVW